MTHTTITAAARMRRGRATLLAAALATVAASPAAAATSDERAAKRILSGTAWTTYAGGSVTGASQDRTTHLCGDGRFVVVTTFVSAYLEDPSSYDHPYGESRVTGRWRVARARLSRNRRYGQIVVRYVTGDGRRGSVAFAASRRGTYLAGSPAEVGRSSLC